MCGFLYALVLLLSVVDCLQTSGVTRGGSGIQIGTSDRSAFGKATGYGGRGHSGVKLGEARFPNSTRQRPYTTPSSTTTWFTYAPPSADKNGYNSTLKVSRNFIDGRGLNPEVLSIPSDLGSRQLARMGGNWVVDIPGFLLFFQVYGNYLLSGDGKNGFLWLQLSFYRDNCEEEFCIRDWSEEKVW